MLLLNEEASIPLVPTLPADASTTGPIVIAPRYPLVESLPGTVVNDQRWRIAGGTYGTEYLGVGGSWVAQGSVTMGVWQSDGVQWYDPSNYMRLIPFKVTGTGAGVTTLRFHTKVASQLYISGNGRFYTDPAGTLGESSFLAVSANADVTAYIRLPSGNCNIWTQGGCVIDGFGDSSLSFISISTNGPALNKMNTRVICDSAVNIRIVDDLSEVVGNTYPWVNVTQNIYFIGNLMSLTGQLYPWVNATKSILFGGNLMSLTGQLYPWVNATKNIYFSGNLMSLTGQLYPWVNVTQSILFSGNLMSLTGQLYPWVNVTQNIYFSGNLMSISYPSSVTLGTKYSQWYLRPAIGYMPYSQVDLLLIDLAATWTEPAGVKTVDLRGNCGARTSASNAAVATLTGRGITVYTN